MQLSQFEAKDAEIEADLCHAKIDSYWVTIENAAHLPF
jgi:hypothetical protein